jgi:hypothetical protein
MAVRPSVIGLMEPVELEPLAPMLITVSGESFHQRKDRVSLACVQMRSAPRSDRYRCRNGWWWELDFE